MTFSNQPFWVRGWFGIGCRVEVKVGRNYLARSLGKPNRRVSRVRLTHILELHGALLQALTLFGGARFINWRLGHSFLGNADEAQDNIVLARPVWVTALRHFCARQACLGYGPGTRSPPKLGLVPYSFVWRSEWQIYVHLNTYTHWYKHTHIHIHTCTSVYIYLSNRKRIKNIFLVSWISIIIPFINSFIFFF